MYLTCFKGGKTRCRVRNAGAANCRLAYPSFAATTQDQMQPTTKASSQQRRIHAGTVPCQGMMRSPFNRDDAAPHDKVPASWKRRCPSIDQKNLRSVWWHVGLTPFRRATNPVPRDSAEVMRKGGGEGGRKRKGRLGMLPVFVPRCHSLTSLQE